MTSISNSSEIDLGQILAALVDSYAIVGSSALACYDYILTYQHEFDLFFDRKWSGGTWLLFVNRYVIILGAIQAISPYSKETCENLVRRVVTYLLFLLPPMIAAAFSTLRVYALSNRNILVAAPVILLSAAPVVLNLYRYVNSSTLFVNSSFTGGPSCAIIWLISPDEDLHFTLASRCAAIAAEIIVITITWIKTYPHARQALRQSEYLDFTVLLFRDGSLYFAVLVLFNIFHVVLSITPALQMLNPISSFASLLQSILISHFLIDLRQVKPDLSKETVSLGLSTVDYIVGNLGESLDILPESPADNIFEHVDESTLSVSSSEEQLIP